MSLFQHHTNLLIFRGLIDQSLKASNSGKYTQTISNSAGILFIKCMQIMAICDCWVIRYKNVFKLNISPLLTDDHPSSHVGKQPCDIHQHQRIVQIQGKCRVFSSQEVFTRPKLIFSCASSSKTYLGRSAIVLNQGSLEACELVFGDTGNLG